MVVQGLEGPVKDASAPFRNPLFFRNRLSGVRIGKSRQVHGPGGRWPPAQELFQRCVTYRGFQVIAETATELLRPHETALESLEQEVLRDLLGIVRVLQQRFEIPADRWGV